MVRINSSLIELHMTNLLEIKGNWNIIKGKLKQKYAELTDSDLTWIDGKQDELLGRLQVKLGLSKEELDTFISENKNL